MKFGTLKIKMPDGKLREYPLDQPSLSIGRAPGNELIIEDSSISRRHARLTVESGHLMIEDLNSANGTFIGSQRIPPAASSLVPENQTVRLGNVEIRYSAPPPVEATQAFVNKPSLANIAPAVAPDGPSVNISLVGPTLPVAPGSVTTATLTVQNRGTVVDELIIQVTGIPADWLRLSKDRLPLLPNAQEIITITFQPPRRPDAAAADHPFTLTVTSREHRSRASAQGVLKVLPFQNFTLNLDPVRSRRDFKVAIQNQGNAPVAYRFSGMDDEQGLDFIFGQDSVSLQPGQSGAIPLQVSPKIKTKVGSRETRSFSVIAAPIDPAMIGAIETKAMGQLIIRPPIPRWLIPLLLVLSLLVCAGAALAYTQVCSTLGPNLPLCPSNARPVINVFTVTPGEIEKGGQIAIQWDVSNADKVELTQPVQETLGKQGVKTYNVEQSTNFTLHATNFAGEVEKSITVKLKNSPPVIQSYTAEPPVVVAGKPGQVALSWTVAGADSVSIEGVPGANGATGSVKVDPPTADQVFTLVATNSAGTTKQQLTIHVDSGGCTLRAAAKMHEGPAEVYRVIDSLPAAQAVAPVGRNATGEWLRVQATKEGWVNASAIQCSVALLQFATVSPADVPPLPTSTPSATPTATPTVTPVPQQTIYDFKNEADKASWQGNGTDLAFPGNRSDNTGSAFWINAPDSKMEDGSVPNRCLWTHPQWMMGGNITGLFLSLPPGYVVDPKDHLVAKFGFLDGASAYPGSADVTFKVWVRHPAPPNSSQQVHKTYTGSLAQIDWPLAAWAGQTADFILEVDANNANATADWACWTSVEIVRGP